VFGTTGAGFGALLAGDAPGELTADVQDAWVAFARTGDPNHPGLPDWSAYETTRRATMLFDATSRVVDDPDGDERRLWERSE
jgi:para-nitrobenzyl esterase